MLRKNLDNSQTIFALTTGTLPSAVAIIKLSGPLAFEIAGQLFFPLTETFEKRRALWFGELKTRHGKKIDDVVVTSFVAPLSHSGENTVELHCHGSIAIIQTLEDELLSCGARPAERGEFSYRAILNGKQSAAELETLADIFKARQPMDLERLYARKDGSLQRKIGELRERLIGLQAIFDTAVDFSEEYSSVVSHAGKGIAGVIRECSEITQRYSRFLGANDAAQLPRLVLAGRPNAGKSSLFNALLGRYRAIVSPEAGTTRDVIEENIRVAGIQWKLVDTAGIREGITDIEREGIEIGETFLSAASFWVLVVNGAEQAVEAISKREIELIEKHSRTPHLIVWNKSDLKNWQEPPAWLGNKCISVSALTANGLEALWAKLEKETAGLFGELNHGPLPTAVQAARLSEVESKLGVLRADLEAGSPPEILAEKNREVLRSLENVVGFVGNEEVLGRIFSEFCIGK